MDRDELAGWLRLALTPQVGLGAARRLLAAFGLPARIFAADAAALRDTVSRSQVQALQADPPALAEQV